MFNAKLFVSKIITDESINFCLLSTKYVKIEPFILEETTWVQEMPWETIKEKIIYIIKIFLKNLLLNILNIKKMIMQIPIDEIIRLLGATDPDKILGIKKTIISINAKVIFFLKVFNLDILLIILKK